MRLVEGIDLAALLERDGPPPAAAAWITAQVASALDAAHADGLVHRDVKPSNVVITGHRQSMPFAYLIDFGIARAVDSASMSTGTGTIGTVAYMAPERIGGAPGDHRADVYSSACTFAAGAAPSCLRPGNRPRAFGTGETPTLTHCTSGRSLSDRSADISKECGGLLCGERAAGG